MKINKRLIRKSTLAAAVIAFLGLGTSCTDIWSEQHPGTYYTNNGETVADYLSGKVKDHGNYSYFIAILEKAELWGQMRTYGTYTCFAPDDDAMQAYFDIRRDEAPNDSVRNVFSSLENVLNNRKLCDTIARTHLFNNAMYASDLNGDGVLQHPNMLDRYVTYNSYPDSSELATDIDGNVLKAHDGSDSVNIRLKYIINMQASLIKTDDSVQNGVVHKVDKVIRSSNQFLPGLMKENPNLTIFYSALVATKLIEKMDAVYFDESYPEIEYSWTEQALRDNYPGIHRNYTAFENTAESADRIAYPDKREFKFTMFVMPDTALATYSDNYWSGGIKDLNDLREYAKKVYNDADHINDADTLTTSPLYKLIAYHILPCWLSYDQFNTRQPELVKRHLSLKEHDIEDFFATMLPHSIMRISTPYPDGATALGIFINRRGTATTGLVSEGVRIAQNASEYNLPGSLTNICVNGGYHYINKLLVYDEFTRATALQCRMRIMCCTLSPDFINSRGRGRLNGDTKITNIDKMSMAYKLGYCENFLWVEDQTKFFVRYRDKGFGTYNGDELSIRGAYDLAFKLPPVPTDGTYEIRMWNNSLASDPSRCDRGIVQFYMHRYNPVEDGSVFWRNWKWDPQGIPVDLRLGGGDSRIGMVSDNDERYDGMTAAAVKEAIKLNDRAMRIRGYLKAPDSFTTNGNNEDPIRYSTDCYRMIVATEYLSAENDYWIRMRQVYEEDGVFPFSFIEIVPKSIYEGSEDQH